MPLKDLKRIRNVIVTPWTLDVCQNDVEVMYSHFVCIYSQCRLFNKQLPPFHSRRFTFQEPTDFFGSASVHLYAPNPYVKQVKVAKRPGLGCPVIKRKDLMDIQETSKGRYMDPCIRSILIVIDLYQFEE